MRLESRVSSRLWIHVLLLSLIPFAFCYPNTHPNNTYDYVVVGSGPGGGPLAANLARNGYSVLLVEAGDDQSNNLNSEIPDLFVFAYTDPTMRWDFFVRHYADDARTKRNSEVVYRQPDGSFFVGTSPPPNSTLLGMFYPRGGTLGGSSAINAMTTVLPSDSDWQNVVNLTNDLSWSPSNMRKIFQRIEKNLYLPVGTPGHGFNGYLDTNKNPVSSYDNLTSTITVMQTIAASLGQDPSKILQYLGADINKLSPQRDQTQGVFDLTVHVDAQWRRFSSRDYVLATANAVNPDGSKRYPLYLQLNTVATKILFKPTTPWSPKPIATGVQLLQGQSLYAADPRHTPSQPLPASTRALAAKEVIISGGTFNSPQLLLLSGIGPSASLSALQIPTVVDLPGVGANLQDNYELPIVMHAQGPAQDLSTPTNPPCTLGAPSDPCIPLWQQNHTGPYTHLFAFNGNFHRTPAAPERDIFFYASNIPIRGFAPPSAAPFVPDPPNTFAISTVKMHVQNRGAGSVRLRTANPLDVPDINFNYFGSRPGNGTDLRAMLDAIKWARRTFMSVPAPVGPVALVEPPCPGGPSADGTCDDAADREWILDQAFSHHCTSTCAIGADGDKMAVLDSRFRVRGTERLRVVDASAFPRTPGAFPVLATFMLSEKASGAILEDAGRL
ncbi:GMC oxidoreductase-like protein [Cercophora scortea]|uniref:GMC oxidoreductase-like protein n=1 Tax=Cercophora scortea TaxID=314031 RepID=A0AAE0M9I1_9PEZI|nr:GMC oxidoreductase-like protein [Cercophora scortea]